MQNKAHKFRSNHLLNMQDRFIFFDTETKITKTGKIYDPSYDYEKDYEEQELKVGWATYYNHKTKIEIHKLFDNANGFWDFVESKIEKRLYLYAHNMDFDFKQVNGFEQLIKDRGWELKSYYIEGKSFIIRMKKDKKNLIILDTMNYSPTSLKDIGESIGLDKMEIDFKKCTDKELSTYCFNDVQIIKIYLQNLIRFLEDDDLSMLKNTSSSLAFNVFRHKFYDENEPIYIHADDKVIDLERKSFKGGITDCMKVGRYNEKNVKGKKLYKLDFASMYPAEMKQHKYPFNKRPYIGSVDVKGMKELLKTYHVIAQIDFYLPKDKAYILTKGKIGKSKKCCFAWGDMIETLCTPEIEYVIKNGVIKSIRGVCVYDKKDIFSEYVDFFYGKRLYYREKKNKCFENLCKLFLNGLFGKFSQKQMNFEVLKKDMDDFDFINLSYKKLKQKVIKKGDIIDNTIDKVTLIQIGKKLVRCTKTDENSFDSFVAISSMVTSYGRMKLIQMIEQAGRENVYYLDTDCLIVNEAGYIALEEHIDLSGKKTLGKLELEGTSTDSIFYRPKYYIFGEEQKCKGVKKTHKVLYEDDEKYIISQSQFEKFKTSFRHGNKDKQLVTEIIKTMNKTYDKGHIMDDGSIEPYNAKEISI